MPQAECRRIVLYSSIQAATRARARALVAKCSTRRSSNSRVECQDSMTALSSADPGLPMDWLMPSREQAARKAPAVYSLPWSELNRIRFNTDRGSQYTGRAFRDACLSNGIIPSVGKTGICFDNAAAESWNATFKKELIHLHAWKGLAHVRHAAFEYIEVYYNRTRIQKALGYLSPSEFELGVDIRMAQVA
jgi:transposase InsO family protein